jgi:hypothetical protein
MFYFTEKIPDANRVIDIYQKGKFLTLAEYQPEKNNLKYWDLRSPIEIDIEVDFEWCYSNYKSIRAWSV